MPSTNLPNKKSQKDVNSSLSREMKRLNVNFVNISEVCMKCCSKMEITIHAVWQTCMVIGVEYADFMLCVGISICISLCFSYPSLFSITENSFNHTITKKKLFIAQYYLVQFGILLLKMYKLIKICLLHIDIVLCRNNFLIMQFNLYLS